MFKIAAFGVKKTHDDDDDSLANKTIKEPKIRIETKINPKILTKIQHFHERRFSLRWSAENMDCGRSKMRKNVEGDIISSLPDDLIHIILSFLNIKVAIKTGVLSSRWRFIWTTMPYLNFSTTNFSTLPKFSKFVTNFLSHRNNLADVYSLKLKFRGKATQVFMKKIMIYAFSHNIQQLNVEKLRDNCFESFFFINSCFTSTLDLPTLTTLELHSAILCDDEADNISVLSRCVNLKNLTLKKITQRVSNDLSIIHPRRSNLTLESCNMRVVNVVAPQLKNLTIRFCDGQHVISASDLAFFFYKGSRPLHLISTEGFLSLEKAHIRVEHPHDADAQQIVCLLQQLHNVKFLTLNLEIVEILSWSVDLILHQPSPFVNLKSLEIYPEHIWGQSSKQETMSTKLKSYLLDSSPGCTITMVLREEIQAEYLMAELKVFLEKEKDDTNTKRAHVDQGKTRLTSHIPRMVIKPKPRGNMVQIKSYWDDLGMQLQQRKQYVCDIISKLQRIEGLLRIIPASKRIKFEPCYASLCAEADIAISKITDGMKIICDKNQSRSSDRFRVPLY